MDRVFHRSMLLICLLMLGAMCSACAPHEWAGFNATVAALGHLHPAAQVGVLLVLALLICAVAWVAFHFIRNL